MRQINYAAISNEGDFEIASLSKPNPYPGKLYSCDRKADRHPKITGVVLVGFKNETHAQIDLLKPIVTAQVRSASATKVVRRSKQVIMKKVVQLLWEF